MRGIPTIVLVALAACSDPGPPGAARADLAVTRGALAASERTIPYSGHVDFDGQPVNAASVKFNFVIYPCDTPGVGAGQCAPLWLAKGAWSNGWPANQFVTLPIFAGRFTVELGGAGQNPLPDAVFLEGHEVLYLGVQLEGRALGTLQKIAPATHAISASEADRLRVRSAIDFDDGAAINGSPVVVGSPSIDGALDVSGSLDVGGALLVHGPIGYLGRSPANPGRSCGAILQAVPGSSDGLYWVSPDDGAAFQVACDMTRGGLTFASFERGAKRPIAWWDMETTAADGSVMDLVGGNDLVLHGSPVAGQPGRQGLTYRINTTQDFFVSKSAFASQLLGNNPKSASAWVRLPAFAGTNSHAPVLSFGGTGASSGSAFSLDVTVGPNAYFVDTQRDQDTGIPLALNAWHHLAVTFDSRVLRIYVDGEVVHQGSRTLATLNGFDRYVVGADSWWSTTAHQMGQGQVDEPKVYDYALDSDEVRELFVLGKRGTE
ncbi:MAG: LamG-like jellyroll fold domain-containing protein [Myxococcota bacterium]